MHAGATAPAKAEMRTFPVLAGAGVHDVYPAPDGALWFTAQSARQTRPIRSENWQVGCDRAGGGCSATRRDRRPRRRRLDHRRPAERDRAGGSRDPRRQAFSAAQGAPRGEPEPAAFDHQGVFDPTIFPDLAAQAARGYRHDDPLLVNIKPNIRDTIPQDPSPMHEARHRPIRRNPRHLHTVRRVAPSLGGHVV